jgi:hypothetical protein
MKLQHLKSLSRLLPVFLLAGTLFVGCGGDDGGGGPHLIVISDFQGEWVITLYKATSVANPFMSLELISVGGAITFDADENGDFTGRMFIPAAVAGMTVEIASAGNIEIITQDTLLVSFTPEMPPFLTDLRGAFEMTGNTVTLYDANNEFNFGGGTEAAIFEGAMVKNDGSYPPIIFTADFEGHWEATGYTVTSNANPMVSINTIDEGAEFVFDVGTDGTALIDVSIPGSLTGGEDVDLTDVPGAFQLDYQDTMTIAFTPEIPPFLTNTRGHFAFEGDECTLTDENTYFDFGEGPVPATAVVEVERTSGGK